MTKNKQATCPVTNEGCAPVIEMKLISKIILAVLIIHVGAVWLPKAYKLFKAEGQTEVMASGITPSQETVDR